MKSSIILLLLLVALNVQSQKTEYKTITVEPHQSLQNYEHFKRLVLKTSEPSIEFISGFKMEWGYRYQLDVKIEHMDVPLSDGTNLECTLVKEVSKTKAPADYTFRLFLDSELYYNESESEGHEGNFKPVNDSTFIYLEEVEIEVPKALQPAFAKIRTGAMQRVGHFTFVDIGKIRLMRIQ